MTFAEMEVIAQPGDYLFMWGKNPPDYAIENLTHGPSHVILLAKFPQSPQFFEFEAVPLYGCRLLPLSHYADSGERMVLCRRKGPSNLDSVVQRALEALGRKYDFREEVEIAFQILAKAGRVWPTDNEFFCSGYVAYAYGDNSNPTPIQLLQSPETEVVGWVN